MASYIQPMPSHPYIYAGDDIAMSNINPSYQDEISPVAQSSAAGHLSGQSQLSQENEAKHASLLLENLPSKLLEKMATENIRMMSLRRKASSKRSFTGHVPIQADITEDLLDSCVEDGNITAQITHIRSLTMNMSQKKKLKKKLEQKSPSEENFFKWSCSNSIKWKRFKGKLAEFGYFLQLWQGHLKKIEGHFGTGVLSYFLFLKWLFFINIPVFVLTFSFVILPQILFHAKDGNDYQANVTTFNGLELLTGSGWFTWTELYYGFYTSNRSAIVPTKYYNMPHAYLFTCGGYYILCLIILALSLSKSYKQNYIEGSGAFDFYYVTRVFCGWDYGITSEDSASLKHKGIYNEFKEYLSGTKIQVKKSLKTKCKWFCILVLTNTFVLAMIGGSGFLIYFISQHKYIQTQVEGMALALCVSGLTLVLPFIFSLIARAESYEKPKNELYVNMTRTMLLKAVILGVLVSFWYRQLSKESCWETKVGQEIYRLVIVDFIVILLTTFFVEFIRRLIVVYICNRNNKNEITDNSSLQAFSYPEFDIGRNTLSLIYSQALCWLGTYFAPMLSLIMIFKLFIIFYVKRLSVIQNCRPPLRPWRASRAHTIFMGFLFCFFILAATAVACAIIFLKPSVSCGPFVNYNTSYEVVVNIIDGWQKEYDVLYDIVQVISSSGFIAAALVVLLVFTYYMRIVMVGHKEMVQLLRQQLSMEGRDKAYLLKMLQDANEKHKSQPKPTQISSRILSTGSEASGGQQFLKPLDKLKNPSTASLHQRRGFKDEGQGAAY